MIFSAAARDARVRELLPLGPRTFYNTVRSCIVLRKSHLGYRSLDAPVYKSSVRLHTAPSHPCACCPDEWRKTAARARERPSSTQAYCRKLIASLPALHCCRETAQHGDSHRTTAWNELSLHALLQHPRKVLSFPILIVGPIKTRCFVSATIGARAFSTFFFSFGP